MKQIVAWKQVREPMSLEETTAEWNRRTGENITRQRVQQVIHRAIRKIRRRMEDDPALLRDLSAEMGLEPAEVLTGLLGKEDEQWDATAPRA